jgi:hypothetical protein
MWRSAIALPGLIGESAPERTASPGFSPGREDGGARVGVQHQRDVRVRFGRARCAHHAGNAVLVATESMMRYFCATAALVARGDAPHVAAAPVRFCDTVRLVRPPLCRCWRFTRTTKRVPGTSV